MRGFDWMGGVSRWSTGWACLVLLVGPLNGSAASRVLLDETSAANLGLKTAPVGVGEFEETLFVLGRVEAIPSRRAVVSSRASGRVLNLLAFEGARVSRGDVVTLVESRQPGNPPPTIELTAPIDGVISDNHISVGEPVEPDVPVMEILDLSEVYAVAYVPEDLVARLNLGMSARLRVSSLPDEVIEAELVRFGSTVDLESGTLEAVFLVASPSGAILPNMRVEFSIILERRQDVMTVPKEAILTDTAGEYVFVTDFDLPNAFVRAPVVTGMRNDTQVEIQKGLFRRDEVVIQGAYPLAYAGGGTLSLKEALDAAHGHEHNEDGSEMTAAQRAERNAAQSGGAAAAPGGLTLFLACFCVLLLGLLGLSERRARRREPKERAADA